MDDPCLIVGLGNPGEEYAGTRHNAGFMLVEELARRWNAGWKLEKKFNARLARGDYRGQRAWLCQPLTFMNLSGEAVRAVADYYQALPGRTLVAVDDADLPLGEIRLRPKGGFGGHHGLESVGQHLGTPDYPRLRIGIGRQAEGTRKLTGYVLGKFAANERELFDKVLARAADQVECWTAQGIQSAMNQFNGSVLTGPEKE